MADLAELKLAQRQLEEQILAARKEVILGIKAQMATAGITLADLGCTPGKSPAKGAKRPVKYVDGKGNTWTGIGQRPRWLRAAIQAGASLDDFKVK